MSPRLDMLKPSWTPVPQVMAQRLQKMILDGELKPGERIPSQRVLSERFNISRASLREALLTLETLGLIKTEPGRGTFVTSDTLPDTSSGLNWRYSDSFSIQDVFETRLMLEPRIASHAARTITMHQLSVLEDATNEMERCWEAGDLLANVEADLLFHGTIATACNNLLLRAMYDTLKGLLTETQRQPIPRTSSSRMVSSLDEHRKIVAAMRQRDIDTAASMMHLHIRKTAEMGGIVI